jgi:hypothetical protein
MQQYSFFGSFEFRASPFLDKCSTIWTMPPDLFCFSHFFLVIFGLAFCWLLASDLPMPPAELGLQSCYHNTCGRKAGREKGDNEGNSETKKLYLRNVTWGETREGSPCPRGLNGQLNSMWPCMGQAVPHISVTCSKWYIRKAPFALRPQPLDTNPLSHCQPA